MNDHDTMKTLLESIDSKPKRILKENSSNLSALLNQAHTDIITRYFDDDLEEFNNFKFEWGTRWGMGMEMEDYAGRYLIKLLKVKNGAPGDLSKILSQARAAIVKRFFDNELEEFFEYVDTLPKEGEVEETAAYYMMQMLKAKYIK